MFNMFLNMPLFNEQNTKGFWVFSRGIKWEQWLEMS